MLRPMRHDHRKEQQQRGRGDRRGTYTRPHVAQDIRMRLASCPARSPCAPVGRAGSSNCLDYLKKATQDPGRTELLTHVAVTAVYTLVANTTSSDKPQEEHA